MFQAKVVEKIKTHILCSKFFFGNRAVCDKVEKCCTAGQATDDNMVYAHCMLDT